MDGEAIVLVLADSLAALERHQLLAAVEPLAIELAPARRLSALVMAAGAALADVIETAIFLLDAKAVTGQLLTIAAHDVLHAR
jgi:hypothetical protein